MSTADAAAALVVGDRVRIERDETRYPSRGTWGQFRGKTGTVAEINVDRDRPHLTEYGVTFGKTYPRTDGSRALWRAGNQPLTWFKAHELMRLLGRQTAQEPSYTPSEGDYTREPISTEESTAA